MPTRHPRSVQTTTRQRLGDLEAETAAAAAATAEAAAATVAEEEMGVVVGSAEVVVGWAEVGLAVVVVGWAEVGSAVVVVGSAEVGSAVAVVAVADSVVVPEDSAAAKRIHILGARKTKSAYQHSASPDGRWHQTRRLLYLERDRQQSYQRTLPM